MALLKNDSLRIFRLNDLFDLLWTRRRIVLSGTAAALLLSVVYLVASSKVYRVHSHVVVSESSELLPPGIPPHVAKFFDLRGRFLTLVLSESFRREFFQKHALFSEMTGKDASSASAAEIDSVFRKRFDQEIQIQDRADRSGPGWLFSFSSHDPVKAARWLNEFIDEANSRAVQVEALNFQSRLERLAKEWEKRRENQLEAAREIEKLRAEHQLARLRTATRIAKKMGLSQPMAGFAQSTDSSGNPVEYFRGAKALDAEIAVMETIKSFTPDPSDLLSLIKSQEMRGIKLDPEGMKAVEVVSQANANFEPAKPRVFMTLILALFVGLFLGALFVLIPRFYLPAPLAE